jgi:hypothetical protein
MRRWFIVVDHSGGANPAETSLAAIPTSPGPSTLRGSLSLTNDNARPISYLDESRGVDV